MYNNPQKIMILKKAGSYWRSKKTQDPGGNCKMHPHPWEMILVEDGQEWHQPTCKCRVLADETSLGGGESRANLVNICMCRCLVASNSNNQSRAIRELKNWLDLPAYV